MQPKRHPDNLPSASNKPSELVVYNDELNSFEWVIECFIRVCKHDSSQAEQLAYLIHFKGKATVKTGDKNELIGYRDALLEKGISARIMP